jgi:predicted esterase
VQKFKVQLAPLVKELESDKTASFYFLQGPYEVTPPTGYEEFFGGPPYYRFIVPSDADSETIDVIERIRDFPQLVMEKEGPFDGIVGYSEGATIAGTLLLHEQMRDRDEGRIPVLKCALFFGGWPPMRPTLDGIVLADESDLTIDIPTVHIGNTP